MALQIGNEVFYFSAVQDSGRLYFAKSLAWPMPCKEISIHFGNQCCYSGYLYIFELHKTVTTEFGLLTIECRFRRSFPFYTYHFMLTGSTTVRKNISKSLHIVSEQSKNLSSQ